MTEGTICPVDTLRKQLQQWHEGLVPLDSSRSHAMQLCSQLPSFRRSVDSVQLLKPYRYKHFRFMFPVIPSWLLQPILLLLSTRHHARPFPFPSVRTSQAQLHRDIALDTLSSLRASGALLDDGQSLLLDAGEDVFECLCPRAACGTRCAAQPRSAPSSAAWLASSHESGAHSHG